MGAKKTVAGSSQATTSTAAGGFESGMSEEAGNSKFNGLMNLTLSDRQLSALKSIRARNASNFEIDSIRSSALNASVTAYSTRHYGANNAPAAFYETNKTFNTMLEKQSKLTLTPANLVKFI